MSSCFSRHNRYKSLKADFGRENTVFWLGLRHSLPTSEPIVRDLLAPIRSIQSTAAGA